MFLPTRSSSGWKRPRVTGRICITSWSNVAISSVSYIPDKPISFMSNRACAPRPTSLMLKPLHGCCSAERHELAMFEADQVAAYRELVRLHTHLSDEAARYQNEIQSPSGGALPRVHPGLC